MDTKALRTVLVAFLAGLLPMLALPTEARAETEVVGTSFVTLSSDAANPIGHGADHLIRSDVGSVTLEEGLNGIVHIVALDAPDAGEFGTGLRLAFAAPVGEVLAPGQYENVPSRPYRVSSRAMMDVDVDGYVCEEPTGTFTVLDAPTDHSRLWIVYRQQCGSTALFGEVRFNEPATGAALTPMADQIAWPETYPSLQAHPVPVSLVNTSAARVTVRDAEISKGGNDFTVLANRCGEALAPGARCVVLVGFKPNGPGPRTGRLTVRDSAGGADTEVPLSGAGITGNTGWRLHSDPGEPFGGERDWTLTPAATRFEVSGNKDSLSFAAYGPDDTWVGHIQAAAGDTLVSGATYINPVGPEASEAPDMGFRTVSHSLHCRDITGTFTVHDIAFAHGRVSRLSLSFVQRCDSKLPLYGSIVWRAVTPPEPFPSSIRYVQGSEIDLPATPTILVAGTPGLLRGRLVAKGRRSGLAGQHLAVYFRPRTSNHAPFRLLRRTTTSATGAFVLPVAPTQGTDYRVVYSGRRPLTVGTSRTRAAFVRHRIALRPLNQTLRRHRAARLICRASTTARGHKAALQESRGGKWRPVSAHRLSSSSATSFELKNLRRGRHRYRVVVAADRSHLWSSSPSALVIVR